MTNEEIDAEIARLTALKEQNNQTQTTENNKPADGIHNPADYIGQIANKMNKQSMNRGDLLSKSLEVIKDAGRRTGFEQDTDGTPLPETAYDWVVQQINAARARGPVNKYTLKAIENGAKVRYNVPGNFNISGPSGIVGFLNGSTERNMARAINSMPYNGKTQKPAQPASTPTSKPVTTPVQNTQVAETKADNKPVQKPAQDISPKTKLDDERTAAYKKIKAKQASDADLALFKNYTEEQLKKVGFGPISIAAIKGTASKTPQQPTNEEKQFMQQYKQYTQQLSGARPSSQAALKTMQESEAYKFVTDPVNTERYNSLVKKQNEANKANKQGKTDKSMMQKIAAAKEDNASYGDMGTFGE